jgi:Right handed beta helix region
MPEVNRENFKSLQDAVTSLPPGYSSVTVPPGVWDEPTRVNVPPDKFIAFHGYGIDRSILRWSSTNGGINVQVNEYERCVVIRNLSLETSEPNGGVAIETTHPGAKASPYRTIDFDSISVRPVGTSGFWDMGLLLRNAWNGRVEGYHFVGKNGTLDADSGIVLGGTTVNFLVSNYHATWVENGLRVEDEIAGSISEGISVINAKLVDVGTGVSITHPGAGFTLIGVHIDARRAGVILVSRDDAELNGLTIYNRGNGKSGFIGILLDGSSSKPSSNCRIQGNLIHRGPATGADRNGIVLIDSQYAVITGNVVHGMDTAIWLKDSSSHSIVRDNLFVGCDILDEGVSNYVEGNHRAR